MNTADTTIDGHIWVFQYSQQWMNCAICGKVKRADGKNKPCNGAAQIRPFEKSVEVKP